MNEEEIANLITRLSADIGNYTAVMAEAVAVATNSSKEIEDSVSKAGVGTFAAGQLIANAVTAIASKAYELGRAAVANFAEAELGAIKLKAAIDANGGAVTERLKDYENFAAAIQRVTVVDDDATLALLQQAETLGVTGDAAKRATKNAIALQAARGISAQAAIRMTTALENGNASMLTRMLPTLRNAKTDTEKVAMAHKLLGNMFKVAEAETTSISGAYKQMQNEIGNTFEVVGEFASQNLGLVSAMQFVRNALVRVQEILPKVFERFQPILDRIKEGGTELFTTIMTKAAEFFTWAEPIFFEYMNLGLTVWNGIKDVAVQAMQLIQDTVIDVWNFLSGSTDTTWEDIKTFMVEAMIAAEFAVKHFDQVAALTWVNMLDGFASLHEGWVIATDSMISIWDATVNRIRSKWTEVQNSIAEAWIRMSSNPENIEPYLETLKEMQGEQAKASAAAFAQQNSQREQATREKLEAIKAERNALQAEASNLSEIMGNEFASLHEQRMGEIGAGGLISSLLGSKDIIDKSALDLGEGAGKALGKGMKDGVKLEGAAVGSAEAMARILATQEALRAGKVTAGVVSGPGGAVVTQSNTGSGRQQNSENKIESYLKELVELARAAANKETFEVEAAGLA